MRALGVVVGLLTLLGGAACSEPQVFFPKDDAGTSAAADAGLDAATAGPDASTVSPADAAMPPDAALPTLTVRVLTGVEQTGLDLSSWTPVAGATVALDKPGGTRVEAVAGLDGRATFEGLDFSLGTADVTAYVYGVGIRSILKIKDASQEVPVLYSKTTGFSQKFVSVEGTASNMSASNNRLVVVSTQGPEGSFYFGPGPSYSVDVATAQPFSLVAFEETGSCVLGRYCAFSHLGWVVEESHTVTAPTTINLDFANKATPKKVEGSFPLPSRSGSVLRDWGFGFVWVDYRAWSGQIGRPEWTQVNAEGTGIEYAVEWVEPSDVEYPETVYAVVNMSTGLPFSQAIVPGYPTAGAQSFTLLDVPDITKPAKDAAPYPLHQPIEWTLYDTPDTVRFHITRPSGAIVWGLDMPGDTTSFKVPLPPSTVLVDEVLGTDTLTGYIQEVDWSGPVTISRVSGAAGFPLQP